MAGYVNTGYWNVGYSIGDAVFISANSIQNNTSSTGAITVKQVLISTNNTQNNNTITTTITVKQVLVKADSLQNNTSSANIITAKHVLATINRTQNNTSSVNTITAIQRVLSTSNAQNNLSTSIAISITRTLSGTNNVQYNYSFLPIELKTGVDYQKNISSVNVIIKETNLSILYNNLVDVASSITSTSTLINDFPLTNVQNDIKTKVWRVIGNTVNIKLDWSSSQTITCVAIPISNLNSGATMRVRAYSNEEATQILYDTGYAEIMRSPQNSVGINQYQYVSTSIAHMFISKVTNARSLIIDISNTTTQGYIEISRILCGSTWTPKYNTNYGVNMGIISDSTQVRTHSGNLHTNRGVLNKTLTFDLNWLVSSDRDGLLLLLKKVGVKTPIFITIFPNHDNSDREQAYQIYGKLLNSPTISNPIYSVYATSLSIESV
jgi:hypothetical protein